VTGRGHFEVFPVRHEAPAVAGIIGEPTGRYRWRFLDDAGRERMVSTREFRDEGKAKADAGDLAIALRTATYGLRWSQEIADAVRVVDV